MPAQIAYTLILQQEKEMAVFFFSLSKAITISKAAICSTCKYPCAQCDDKQQDWYLLAPHYMVQSVCMCLRLLTPANFPSMAAVGRQFFHQKIST